MMNKTTSERNLFLISASSIFFWLGLRMIQGVSVRLVRDIMVYSNSNNILTYVIGVIVEVSLIVYGILYLYKKLKTETLSEGNFFKISVIIMFIGYILNFINPFLYNFFDMNIYNTNITKYLEFYSSLYVSIIQFIAEIFPIIFIGYVVMKSKSQPQS
ncbi:hypothetical protein SDC9_01605 [bioreactor metagenome]|uniref:Uncharacterized protein n=1 Tax=bioreactor metagenome TaxID=1076179 RepID=A0A644SNA9_9ZZZZ